MGNEASTTADDYADDENPASDSDSHYPDEFIRFEGIETLGYRVLGVQPDSPAHSAGLVSFLDFLVGCNGKMLLGSGEGLADGEEYDDVDFPEMLRASVGTELELLVHNIKSQSERLVKITPNTTWGGAGLLGVTIRLDDYGGADQRLIRLLTVEHNSPASIAGLVASTDYLLGTTSSSFESDESLAQVIMAHADRVVEIYVYSSESDVVRVVTLMPTLSWGGRGLLGAEVGTGYLHRFPKACRSTDGRSVGRRIRMGGRPTDVPPSNEAQAREQALGMGVDAIRVPFEGSHGEAADANNGQGEQQTDNDNQETVDLAALTGAMAGTAMHFEAQLEMEQTPPSSNGTVDPADAPSRPKQNTQSEDPNPALPQTSATKTTNGNGAATPKPVPPPRRSSSSSEPPPEKFVSQAEALFAFPPPRENEVCPTPTMPPHAPLESPLATAQAKVAASSVSAFGLPPPPIRRVEESGEVDLR